MFSPVYGEKAGATNERLLTRFCRMSLATRHTGHVANLLVRFALASDKVIPAGWAPRTLIQCGVAYPEIWDILHGMYESQVPFTLLVYRTSFSFISFLFSIILRVPLPSIREIVDTLTTSRLSYVFTTSTPFALSPVYSPISPSLRFIPNTTDPPV